MSIRAGRGAAVQFSDSTRTAHAGPSGRRGQGGPMAMADANHVTLIGIFDDPNEAEEAVGDLQQAGFESDDVEMVIRGEQAVMGGEITDAQGTKDGTEAWRGIFFGGLIGLWF